ncbi:MAG: universal stress protein [Firmicutes bacterium]|nr:universal stress protein [Bacillota bacterium]
MIERILVPLDGSEFSEHVLDWLAPRVDADTHLILLRVVPTLGATDWAGFGAWSTTPGGEPADDPRSQARAYLEGLRERLSHAGAVKVVVEAGDPGPEILEAARRFRVDAVAMASHGRAGLGRKLIGSVAEYVLQRAAVPLFLVGPRSYGLRPVGRAPSVPRTEG